jgi:formate dehydrogenase major subunit
VLYNRASADLEGRPWSDRKALVWWDEDEQKWTGHDVPDFVPDKRPDYEPPPDGHGPEGLSGTEPFIMQADGRGWLFAPSGVTDGPLPTYYEPQESPVTNPLYRQQRNPVRTTIDHPDNRYHPSGNEPGTDVYPFVVTTYRLTEHFTAGGMSRWTPYLAELQPELFCEVSPELAALRRLDHGGWATLVSARGAIEARVMVTDRMTPLRLDGRVIHQIGMPYHWGPNGYARGDAVNELSSMALDPSSHIQEVKALTVDIHPGPRPTGPARTELVREYRRRAGIGADTGMKP